MSSSSLQARKLLPQQTMEITACATRYELRFADLFNSGCRFAFPCDADGHVDIDGLCERTRSNYFYARAVVGRELTAPFVAVVD